MKKIAVDEPGLTVKRSHFFVVLSDFVKEEVMFRGHIFARKGFARPQRSAL